MPKRVDNPKTIRKSRPDKIVNLERLQAFGRELRRKREAAAIDAKAFAAATRISPQHLSQLENAYAREGRAPVAPGDELIVAISTVLRWRVIDIRRLLGQIPDVEVDQYPDPVNSLIIRSGYDDRTLGVEDMAKLREGIETLIAGYYERMRRSGIG